MKKEAEVKSNVEVKEGIAMSESAEMKDTTAKAGEATKEIKADDKKTVKKSMATKKKATEKQTEVTGQKPDKETIEQAPSDVIDEEKQSLDVIQEIEKARGTVVNYSMEEIDQFVKLCKQIDSEQKAVQKSYLNIAIPIYNVYIKRWFELLGYPDIYSFAKKEFNISRGRCSEFKKLIENFGFIDKDTKCCTGIMAEFHNYSVSQLIEMSKMTSELRAMVNDSTPVSEMKALRIHGELAKEASEKRKQKSKKTKRQSHDLLKADNLDNYESLKKTLLSKLSKFADEHEDLVHNIKITLSYEE